MNLWRFGFILLALIGPVPQGATATPTPTATPTATPTTTATLGPRNTPTCIGADAYEPNDVPEQAQLVGAGTTLQATLHLGDVDWWQVYLKAGRNYRIEAQTKPGGDPRMVLYTATLAQLAQNDDCALGSYSPCIRIKPTEEGVYLVQITSQVAGLWADYTLQVVEELPTPTPTLTPQPTAGPTATPQPTGTPVPSPTPNDPFEPNQDFDHAAEIGLGQTVAANLPTGDRDFYRLYLKNRLLHRCEINPQGGLDPNLTLYDAGRNVLGGNDDRAPGQPGPLLNWLPGGAGWITLVVDPVTGSGSYTLLCTVLAPTPTTPVTPLPPAPTPTRWLIPTATSLPGLENPAGLGGGDWAQPGATGTPLPPVKVVVYYDENDNNAADPAEGIQGATVLLLDASTNKPIAWQTTDETGYTAFEIPAGASAYAALRIAIPFLGFSRPVGPGQAVPVAIEPQRLPGLIP